MKLNDFIEAVEDAGWWPTSDAQHDGIAKLHAEIFPTVAALEKELAEANDEIFALEDDRG